MGSATSYSFLRKILHWLTAVLVVAAFAVIWQREGVDDPAERLWLLHLHRSLGLLAGMMMLIRLCLRLAQGHLPAPDNTSRLQAIAASLAHDSLYGLGIILPLLGWAYSSAKGRVVEFFGLLSLPSLLERNRDWADRLGDSHEMLAFMLAGLILLHLAAALYHWRIRRDDVLDRMLFRSRN